ncbi:MAG: type I restriction endonuclease subunit R, partial [Psychrilyobacter sp.]|uniref:type I restriction endonuclease subunit R n=1 Tax=Psychrilyobacter sp. TaxID=2586924 RepID=UPI003C72DEDF
MNFTEDQLEQAYIHLLTNLGYEYRLGGEIEEDERGSYHEVLLLEELRNSIYKINKEMPTDAKEEAIKKIRHLYNPTLIGANEEFHKMVTDGIDVPYKDKNGNDRFGKIYIFDFEDVENNTFIAVNQFTIIQKTNRRPDIILFVNGIPMVVIELKSMINEEVGITEAYNQIQRYKDEISDLFKYNSFIVLSDGINAKTGTISSNLERFMSFRSVDGEEIRPKDEMMMETLTHGMLTKERLLELTKDYILFMKTRTESIKILAQYHQFFAVKKALKNTKKAKESEGRIGVVWHTQGSGKSLTMTYYAGQLMKKFNNPTIIVVTDRNDLDNQLHGTFAKCSSYLVENPKQAEDKDQLRDYLDVQSGGIIFTTIQKFAPKKGESFIDVLSDRNDIIVMADEAHRSQYGLEAKQDLEGNVKYGYAKHIRDALPNANYIGFTGTPIDFQDKSTTAVFGNYIDTYDMTRAVEDGATVKIYYENRFIKLDLDQTLLNEADKETIEIMENVAEYNAEKKKKEFTNMEAVVGSSSRIRDLAQDLVTHWESRKNAAFGKAMIVCMSRRICVELYSEIVRLRPGWHDEDKAKGKIKVIMTNDVSKYPMSWKQHFTTKQEREELANRMKDESDELEISIVRDMWLTGFDVPCMHTMYIDKSMAGHNLMQAIARVNRVFKDKEGGLVVDYIGIADKLKKALNQYSASDRNTTGIDLDRAVQVMLEYYEVVRDMMHGYEYSGYKSDQPMVRGKSIIGGMNYILEMDLDKEGLKKEFVKQVASLAKAHSLCVSTEDGKRLNEEVAYFKAVKATLVKQESPNKVKPLSDNEINKRMATLLGNTIISEEVIDIYKELGIEAPNMSVLSDDFLEEIRSMEYKNLAVEMLKKLIEGKIKSSSRKNLVMSEKFSDKLKRSLQSYRNKAITSLEVMDELIKMAKDFQDMQKEGNDLGLTDDEAAFYSALATEDILAELEDCDILKKIA